jgi:hypothetical protein
MFGLKPVIVGSGLMTSHSQQYESARETILRMMQDELDAKNPPVNVDSGDDNSLDGKITVEDNDNYRIAEKELNRFEEYKRQKYLAKLKLGRSLSNEDSRGRVIKLGVGPVESRGDDLPSGNNIATYLDKKGRFQLLPFFKDHKALFPNLFTIVQREASRRVTEVGCERFFGVSGYISQPRRARLGVRNYERISLLSFILKCVYIDPELVAKEYLRR